MRFGDFLSEWGGPVCMVAAMLLWLILFAVFVGRLEWTIQEQRERIAVLESAAADVPETIVVFAERDEVIDKLAHCESGRRDNVVIIDTNGELSAGRLQFQHATLSAWFSDNVGFALTQEEYLLVAKNRVLIEAVAGDILETGWRGGARNWLLCAKMIGLIPEGA